MIIMRMLRTDEDGRLYTRRELGQQVEDLISDRNNHKLASEKRESELREKSKSFLYVMSYNFQFPT